MTLTRRQIIELTYAIRERRRALLEEVAEGIARVREDGREALADGVPDSGDQAQADLIGELDLAYAKRDLGELEELDGAARRLADGSYGICLDCGADIPLERLQARPGAPRCVDCQRRHEVTYRT